MTYETHSKARKDRAALIGTLIGSALGSAIQFVSKAWRSSSSKGTNSSALS
ncbi:hypothetical protein DSM104443_02987 [Usitatibacter rugosus]|uniref:Uncharacterized protein n=1 Tax=Usitatibacter rugosus TaxID=2732067 RepID=A0A6M4GZF4_9PROT|nr:hypothetical protein DSM104443_02987 [Usitatibacter rugosus]